MADDERITLQELLDIVEAATPQQLTTFFSKPDMLAQFTRDLTHDERIQFIVAKNIKIFGGINEYVEDFLDKTVPMIASMPEGVEKERLKEGYRYTIDHMLTHADLTDTNKEQLESAKSLGLAAAPAAGGKRRWKMPRKMTRRYCKKTSCRKMGFTQKASCRPWKNCY